MVKALGLILLLFHFAAASQLRTIDVVAIEYPPFTSFSLPDKGIAFSLLQAKLADNKLVKLSEHFLPPASAQVFSNANSAWCLSFYPPEKQLNAEYIPLSEFDIKLGFVGKKSNSLLKWQSFDELKGRRIAMLRANSAEGIYGALKQHGVNIIDVETVQQGINLLVKGRVELAFSDSVTFAKLQKQRGKENMLGFANKSLMALPIGVYLNRQCPYGNLVKSSLKNAKLGVTEEKIL